MSDPGVDKWKQKGNLYLWHYLENSRNYPGWHLTADDHCCFDLVELIETMLLAQWSSEKTLIVSAPTKKVLSVPNNRGGNARFESATFLTLKHPKDKVAEDYFALEAQDKRVCFTVGSQKLELLKDCLSKIPEGKGDYAIKAGETRLWFWWSLKELR